MSGPSMGPRLNHAYLAGVCLGVNAVPDVSLLVDGPDCVFHKASQIHGRHDLCSTLVRGDGRHRVHYTDTRPNSLVADYDATLRASVEELARDPLCRTVLVTSVPFCTITGVQYDRIIRQAKGLRVPASVLPGGGLDDDHLDGYAAFLTELARMSDLSGRESEPGAVAVVGHFMDRNEYDQRANVAELERLLAGISLKPVSIWLSGRPLSHLAEAKRASAVISLPHGREAAEVLANRLEVPLIVTELPIGIHATGEWLRRVADAMGKSVEAERFIEAEQRVLVPRLAPLVPRVTLNKRFAWIGDPHVGRGVSALLRTLGGRLIGSFFASRETPERSDGLRGLFAPSLERLREEVRRLDEDGLDLLIGSNTGLMAVSTEAAMMEFGYPSCFHHALRDEPSLGYSGCVAFTQRMADALMDDRRNLAVAGPQTPSCSTACGGGSARSPSD